MKSHLIETSGWRRVDSGRTVERKPSRRARRRRQIGHAIDLLVWTVCSLLLAHSAWTIITRAVALP